MVVTTVNFAAQTIANTYSGNLTLDGNDAVDFSYSFTTDYSGGSASTQLDNVTDYFSINKSTGATAQ